MSSLASSSADDPLVEEARIDDELIECVDCSVELGGQGRAFIDFAQFQTHIQIVHADMAKEAHMTTESTTRHSCSDPTCDRDFLTEKALYEHAEAVHTFSDIEELVRDAVRDKYNVEGDYRAVPPVRSVYAWCRDFSTDWVVFEMNKADKGTLYKSSYSITDGVVTLGAPVEVVRKTVYEPVTQATSTTAGV